MTLHVDAQGQVNGFFDDHLVLPDFDDNTVLINGRVNCIQGPGLPLDDLLYDRISDLLDQGCRDISVVHFLGCGDDLPGGHALGIQEENLFIHRCESALVLLDQLRLEATCSICRGVQLKLAFFGLQDFADIAIAVIAGVGLLILAEAQMIFEFRIQRSFDRDFGQHLPELVEVILSFDIFSGSLSNRLLDFPGFARHANSVKLDFTRFTRHF